MEMNSWVFLLAILTAISQINTPPLLGFLTLVSALLASGVLFNFYSPWVGIVMFLVYVSGMLVLLAYFCAMHPNTSVLKPSSSVLLGGVTIGLFSSLVFVLPEATSTPSSGKLATIGLIMGSDLFFFLVLLLLGVLFLVVCSTMLHFHTSLRPHQLK